MFGEERERERGLSIACRFTQVHTPSIVSCVRVAPVRAHLALYWPGYYSISMRESVSNLMI